MTYRKDIDGLRAIAVVSVVATHAGIFGVSGGFVGVDIFFVISGFLITGIVHEQLRAGQFSLADFYQRRIKRIIPALLIVVLFTLVMGVFLLLPEELESLARSSIAASLYVSNLFFWQEADYFAAEAEVLPLLHTWSLAVEEQFYLGFPVVAVLLFKLSRKWFLPVLIMGTLSSFLLCVIATPLSEASAFYLIPTRAWELGVGACLAVWLQGRRASSMPGAFPIGILGFAFIAGSLVGFDKGTLFPGYAAILPVAGAALIILSGEGGRSSVIQKALECPPMIFVGKISYSLYLWHWPILVYSRMALGRELQLTEALLAIGLAVGVSYISWKYIEAPFRFPGSRWHVNSGRRAVALALVAIVVPATGAMAILSTGGLGARLDPQVQLVASAVHHHDRSSFECGPPDELEDSENVCRVGQNEASISTMLWGDSHAMSLRTPFAEMLKARNLGGVVVAHPGCPPLIGFQRTDRDCISKTEVALSALDRFPVRRVVIVASWFGVMETKNSVYVGQQSHRPAQRQENVVLALEETIQTLLDQGFEVAIAETVPEAPHHHPYLLARRMMLGQDGPEALSVDQYRKRIEPVRRVIEKFPKVTLLKADGLLCPDGSCRYALEGAPLYVDSGHPNLTLARLLAEDWGQHLFAR